MSGEGAGWPFANPVLTASGCGGTGRELSWYGDLGALGGFVTRSITSQARPGAPGRRIVESPSGFVNAIGLQNPGVDAFLADELPALVDLGATVVASVVGSSLGEYAEVARDLGRASGVVALEVNLSVPDASSAGVLDVRDPFEAARVVAACRRDLPRDVLLLAKLPSDAQRVVETAHAVAEAGADALVVGNAVLATMPDGRPGGLSGPAIGPLALHCVRVVRDALPGTPVIGVGGIVDARDARAFLRAGARAVQVGSALFHDPTAAHRIVAALTAEGDET